MLSDGKMIFWRAKRKAPISRGLASQTELNNLILMKKLVDLSKVKYEDVIVNKLQLIKSK
jgi:hypothetical protein